MLWIFLGSPPPNLIPHQEYKLYSRMKINSVAKARRVQRRSTIYVTIAVANDHDDIKLLSPVKD